MAQELVISVTGGYNGGATITMTLDNTTVFTSTAPDTYNQNYNNLSGQFTTIAGEIAVNITPPPTSTSALTITLSGAVADTLSIMPAGQNTSYGYNYSKNYEIDAPQPPEQHDTGLGWSAKSNYLLQTAGATIANLPGEIGGPSFPGQPLPFAATRLDVITNGFLLYEKTGLDNLRHKFYIAADTAGSVLVADMGSAPASNFIMYRCVTNVNGAKYFIADSADPNYFYTADMPNSIGSGFYSTPGNESTSGGGSDFALNPLLPAFSNINTFVAAIQTGQAETFTKVNAGYAVACVAKWKTPNNTILESPILISTNSDYVDMATTATGTSLAKLNVLYNGRKFFMSFYDRPYTGTLETVLPVIDRSYSDAPTFTLEQLFRYIAKDVYSNILVTNAPDPYQEGDGSGEAGGDGEDDESDDIDFTDPPSTSIGATGLLTIFCPNLSQLQSLGSYMWSTFDVDNWRKIIANPMDAILGLHIIPVPAVITGTKAVKVAGIDTTIDMSYTTVRYIRRTMGTCEIPKKWGAYLDYSPYTKISIFLPFIGFKELDADDVMGKTIALQYMIDILTGACVAELKCGDTVLYTWSGNCANEVPISGSDWRGAIASAIGIAATVAGTALVTGGATAPMAASMVASVGANSMNLKPTINRSGAISGSAGYMGQKRPYIIRSIPNLVIPADQNKFIGYPSFVTTSLGSLTGYNEIASIHLEGIPATGNELAEIEALLKGGVIF